MTGGAGSIAGMITSLRNNARPRRKIFKAYKEYVATHQQLDHSKTFTHAQREAMQRQFREERRQLFRRAVFAILLAAIITTALLWAFGTWLVAWLTR